MSKKIGLLNKIGGATVGFLGGLLKGALMPLIAPAVAMGGLWQARRPLAIAVSPIVFGIAVIVGTVMAVPLMIIYARSATKFGWQDGIQGAKDYLLEKKTKTNRENVNVENKTAITTETEQLRKLANTENQNPGLRVQAPSIKKPLNPPVLHQYDASAKSIILKVQFNPPQPEQILTATTPIKLEPPAIAAINNQPNVQDHAELRLANDKSNNPTLSFVGSDTVAAVRASKNPELLNAKYHLTYDTPIPLKTAEKQILAAFKGKPRIDITTCEIGGATYAVTKGKINTTPIPPTSSGRLTMQ